ncbi:MAG: hypothetical protein EP297_15295 [Gammaproteobacteria bacterium]|nr:MAG: hypothetical protein EP297_15295 [Gammaproteobacteria bacterium]
MDDDTISCPIPSQPDYSDIQVIDLQPDPPVSDYKSAMAIANNQADKVLGEHMLLSWYDRDRDFESPQHASECHQDSATPGYVDYGLNHGATLKVDIEQGRFIFFYMPLEL